ncbi:MAG: TRAP transporter large permease [Succinivibrio sp.]|nr:TRAP transporter large permease [Succinivibrio sp.]
MLSSQIILYLLVLTPILLVLGVPIGTSICVGSVLSIFSIFGFSKAPLNGATLIFKGMNSFALVAIPFFVLAGNIMNTGGIAQKLINLAKVFIGWIPGALMHTNIVANMLFGAISGSGVAAAAAIGSVMLPGEKREGYDEKLSAAVNIASAPAGMIIPPSNIFIIYSLASGGVSVAALFVAGYIPGILWGLAVMAVTAFFAFKLKYKPQMVGSLGLALAIILDGIPAILLIVIIIGGIISGWFTPTEASCVAVIYAAVLSALYGTFRWKAVPGMLLSTAKTTGLIVFLIGVSSILGWVLAYAKLPNMIAQALLNFSDSPAVILIGMMVIMLLVGCVMDPAPAVLIFTPIFLPVAMKLGINAVHFGVMMVFNLSLGAITPPVGPILFTGCRIAGQTIDAVFLKLLPFFLALVIVLIMVTLIPWLSMFLPTWAGLVH